MCVQLQNSRHPVAIQMIAGGVLMAHQEFEAVTRFGTDWYKSVHK